MATKKKDDPFELYHFDFAKGVAYQFPDGWSPEQKSRFRALPSEEKRNTSAGAPASVTFNGQSLRVRWVTKSPENKS